jgi:hypothetical protein
VGHMFSFVMGDTDFPLMEGEEEWSIDWISPHRINITYTM